ncbi:hypothetical protein A2154_01515 [Candidatus Gottesmanbacteria bacterium RBG_16_43_7]|uniref:Glycosyltransferase RgtA/B/C/D-like domain-containing protein n=1 Tax=Candidatus Gottesmanbacteria bacterium RBG_16_43_7 TaxID=1798373 RepID=A0A1F5Z7C9_9BACT|nr:MAG: hypothetical protein A2154_01515 [Candidatus Gottesmanbacteria bacterium RBG_16_43_7]
MKSKPLLSTELKFRLIKYITSPLIVVIFFGIAIRSVEIINRNYLFGFDQGWNYEFAREIVETKHFRLIGAEASFGGFRGVFHGPGYYYLLAFFYILFYGDPYGGLIYMYTFGILSLVLSAYLAKKIFLNTFTLLYIFLIGICGALISQSRFLWPPHPVTAIFVFIQILIYKFIKHKQSKYILLALFFSAMIYHFHLALSIPLVISIMIFYWLNSRTQILKFLGKSFMVVSLAWLPGLLFEIRHRLFITNLWSYEMSSGLSRITTFRYWIEHGRDYWYNFAESFRFQPFIHGIFWQLLFTTLYVTAVIISYKQIKEPVRSFVKYHICLILITFMFFIFINNTIWNYYLTNLHIAYIFILCVIVSALWQKVSKTQVEKVIISGLLVYILVFSISGIAEMHRMYTSEIADIGGGAKIKGKKELLDFIYEDAGGKSFNIKIFTPPIYTYAFDYMFHWYGRSKYGYEPGNDEKNLTYIIIEPDSAKPWSHLGWLETVIKPGEVEWEKSLKNGFIVQKRMY